MRGTAKLARDYERLLQRGKHRRAGQLLDVLQPDERRDVLRHVIASARRELRRVEKAIAKRGETPALRAARDELSTAIARRGEVGEGVKERELSIVIRAKDAATRTMETISKRVGRLGNIMGTALRAGALAGGAAIAGLTFAALKMAGSFEDARNIIAKGDGRHW